MGDSTSNRSNLVDVTFQELHGYLSGSLEGSSPTQIAASLRHRSSLFRNISEPYGRPSAASKTKVESGTVTLADGVSVKVEDEDKLFVLAISGRFAIDEIQALVLFRSFLYNQGLPKPVASKKESVVVDELLDAITPFYYAERLSLLRTLIPLVQATDDTQNPVCDISEEFLADIASNKPKFVAELLDLYAEKTKGLLPMNLASDARSTAQWLKQNMKEQLVILELLFWIMWSYVNCDGPTVTKIMETAYSTRMGLEQGNAALMLDDESQQLIRDGNALWNVFILEIFELERFASGEFDLSEGRDLAFFPASASALSQIHQLVTSHPDSDYVCIYLAWAFILSRILAVQAVTGSTSDDYQPFLAALAPSSERTFAGGMETIPLHMARMCLSPEAGLFSVIQNLLTSTSLFVTSIAWRTGSSITDPNAVGFRSIIKGLLNALLELVPVEMIPDFEGFADVWIALYGRSDSKSVHTICWQYWTKDWQAGISRRAVFDVARSRFPVMMRPLVCLLRAMTGFGYIETDPIATSAGMNTDPGLSRERDVCNGYVFHYFQRLSSYTLTIPSTNEGVLYEKVAERGKPIKVANLNYIALQDMRVPGGSTIKTGTIGRLLSNDGGDHVVIAWQHEHSGWKFLLEILTHFVYQRRSTNYHQVSFGDKAQHRASVTITLDDLRVGEDDADFEELVVDTLALIRCVVQDDVAHAEDILRMMSAGAPVIAHTSSDTAPPDLVQLITMILEDRLSRGRSRSEHGDVLITSTLSLLSALLAIPRYCDRVWLYLRSTSSLFGSERNVGSGSAILAADRAIGRYTMTLALLRLVEGLFREASASVLPVMADMPKLQEVKEEVLLRAARFVHSEIWVEYSNWKYAHISDRFEIGHRVAAFFADIYRYAPPVALTGHFTALTQAIADTFLFKAATTSIVPLVSAVASAGTTMATLSASRRFGDARRLTLLLESHLALIRSVLNHKQRAGIEGMSLLEETLFARGQNMAASTRVKIDVIDAITGYVRDRRVGVTVPVEAAWILNSLCAMSSHNSSVIAGRLEAPENAMAALVRIGQHPYDDPSLRQAVWAFMTLAIDKEPALATILVSGRVGIPDKFAPKALTSDAASESAFDVACAILTEWKELWELNPRLLSSVIGFLAAVWAHGHEHKTKLDTKRKGTDFWEMIVGVVAEELGPTPDYRVEQTDQVDGVLHSDLHDAVATHAYRTRTKALALRIIDLDVEMYLQTTSESGPKPASYTAMEKILKNGDSMTEHIFEAGLNVFDPLLHDEFATQATADFPALALASLQAELPPAQWECGDAFAFNLSLLQRRMQTYLSVGSTEAAAAEQIVKRLMSINLNLSLAQSQTELTKAWTALIRRVCPYLRSDATFRRIVLALCSTLSTELATESRPGEMMAAIHGEKLALVLALLEVAWFSTNDKADEAKAFMTLVKQLPAILSNPAQYPPSCLINRTSVPFHRTILQIIFFCVQQCRTSLLRPQAKSLVAEQRLAIAAMVDSALNFVIGGLRVVFEAAMQGLDLEIDRDMELLVSVFRQCTMKELTSTTVAWLGRCQEQDIIQASLRLFGQLDVANTDPSTLSIIQSQGEPLYIPHILAFHMALTVIPLAAERLANEGVISSYSNSGMIAAVRMGAVTTSNPDLPSKRNPAHTAYCSMVATVAGVLSVVGRQHHYLDQDTIAFIQLFGDQMTRALSWTIGDPLNLPLLEEIEQTVHLFHAIVESLPFAASQALGQGSDAEPILRIFAGRALILVQQLSYALTHPNHLSTLVEPITLEERTLMEQDEAPGSDSDVVDPFKRPFLTRLVHRLFRLSTLVLVTLANIGGAETVLLGDREDWSAAKAVVVPHSKVVLSEPATTGTLLELCNCAFDILRKLSTTSVASQAVTSAGPRGEKALDAGESTRAVRSTLEAAALYAVTQLALWSVKPNNDENGPNSIELDEPDMERTIGNRIASTSHRPSSNQSLTVSALGRSVPARASSPEVRKVSVSSTTGERMRRGMNSDIAADLYAMLNKAQLVLQKLPKGDRDVDLLAMLAKFLRAYGLVE